MIKIMCVLGTRPEFIRLCPILKEIKSRSGIKLQLIHTGQHYSDNMDEIFFRELGLPKPEVNLNIGPLDPVEQVSKIILETGKVLDRFKPDSVCVWGDTNSSLAVALAAVKKNIPLIHLESGCRSYDMRMSEEINRILIDHSASVLIPFSKSSKNNLLSEKVSGKIIKMGNPHYDVFLQISKKFPLTNILKTLDLKESEFMLLTTHRAENVDNYQILNNIVNGLLRIKNIKIVFPIHPRTKNNLRNYNLYSKLESSQNIRLIEPVGYEEMMDLLIASKFVMTDSGGLQLESYFAKKPCITIRKSTEWIETVEAGVNYLVDPEIKSIYSATKRLIKNYKKIIKFFIMKKNKNLYGNGNSSRKIVDALAEYSRKNE